MKVVIMAGGKGTRISSVASDIPKPMIRICGKPILEHQIENLRACGLNDITLVIGHLSEVIKDYFKNGQDFGVRISYFEETQPLGTAGALFKIPTLTDDFLLMCGDLIINVDFNRFMDFHRKCKAWASLLVHPNDHPFDSSILTTETLPPNEKGGLPIETHKVTGWISKEDERHDYRNRVNAGIEIISPRLLKETKKHFTPRHPDQPDKIDLDRDVLRPNIHSGHIYAYETPEYVKDMGIPSRLQEVEKDMMEGKVLARNLKRPQRAIFLDRDGTINTYKGFLTHVEDFELLPGAAEAIKLINRAGFLAIVVSNQPVIARGECSFETLQSIHNKMDTLLGREGAFLNAIYYCPHHPDSGFAGELPDYKFDCNCRKPKPGLLLKAAHDLNIDLSLSYMIGDSERDVQAGINAGVGQSFLIEKNKPEALLHVVKQICH